MRKIFLIANMNDLADLNLRFFIRYRWIIKLRRRRESEAKFIADTGWN